jgi:putative transposase
VPTLSCAPRRAHDHRPQRWYQGAVGGTKRGRRVGAKPYRRWGRTPRPWKRTTIPDPAATARADLIRRDFAVNAAAVNTRWCGDITYLPTWEGWL